MFFDRTRIYPQTLELVGLAREVIDGLPPGYGFLADQLHRATASASDFSEEKSFTMKNHDPLPPFGQFRVGLRFGLVFRGCLVQ